MGSSCYEGVFTVFDIIATFLLGLEGTAAIGLSGYRSIGLLACRVMGFGARLWHRGLDVGLGLLENLPSRTVDA